MNTATTEQHDWTRLLNLFSELNAGRPTRLGVFEPADGVVIDQWLEDGLPLEGISFEIRDGVVSLAIMLRNFTHTVTGAKKVELHWTLDAAEDGLNATDAEGRTTLLRFEPYDERRR